MLGFETIGNATLIAFDDTPTLVTDPWLSDAAYFGSWGLSFQIPQAQREHIQQCPYVWFSHGHPDHLNGASLPELSSKTILLGDFVGGRIRRELEAQGFRVRVLPDRAWTRLSPRLEVLCITDYFQDSILLLRLGGRLVINLNDASERGWGSTVARIAAQHRGNFLMRLSGYGDADMINLFDESGARIAPWAGRRYPVGKTLVRSMRVYNASYFVPFSSFHCYRRTDSLWAERYTTPFDAHGEGFDLPGAEVLPPFVRVDLQADTVVPLHPPRSDGAPRDPKAFGDDWSEELTAEDRRKLGAYFRTRKVLARDLGFVRLRVGGKEHTVDLNPARPRQGITFEAPRGSLMTAVEYEIFDDLLIGNFVKTTLHGIDGLYPGFTPAVAKYADNGRAFTRGEVTHYFAEYLARAPREFLLHQLESKVVQGFRTLVPKEARFYGAVKRAYYVAKGIPQPGPEDTRAG